MQSMNSSSSTMVELGKDPEKTDKSVKSFTMDETFLNDLLECSVCLEQLDSSSKVLPCQHTFCKRCLQEIVNSHKELRCPECRILVESKIEELPCNILLVRLLEGIKNNVRPRRFPAEVLPPTPETRASDPPHPQPPLPRAPSAGDLRVVPKQARSVAKVLNSCPCAKALYPYEAKVPGDLTFKKGDIVVLRKRVDQNWFYGELNGKSGFVPASFVQVVVPTPSHVPQCKALYDFQISSSEEKDCLTFGKGDILTVIRRIDDHWAEGKLRDRIGIFPISFVEMNAAARAVMKLSLNSQSSSRVVPPVAPTSSDSHFGTVTTTNATSTALSPPFQVESSSPQSPQTVATSPIHSSASSVVIGLAPQLASTSGTQSSQQVAHSSGQSMSHIGHSSGMVLYPGPSFEPRKDDHQPDQHETGTKNRSTPSPGSAFSCVTPPVVSQRAESIPGSQNLTSSNKNDNVASSPMAPDAPKSSHASTRNTCAPTHVPVPTFYLALYTYRPQKEDELELRKGELYTVSEKCQDGWFKGTSLRTGLSGVFPGNYVQIAKSAHQMQPHISGTPTAGRTSPATTSPPPTSTTHSHTRSITSTADSPHLFHPIGGPVIYTNSPMGVVCGRAMPGSSPAHPPAMAEWPAPHHVGPCAAVQQRLAAGRPVSSVGFHKVELGPKQNSSRNSLISPWTSLSSIDGGPVGDFPRASSGSPTRMLLPAPAPPQTTDGCPRYTSASQPSTPHGSGSGNPFAAGAGTCIAGASHIRIDKHKEKKEKEIVSLMKRLTKRKSKSPPPSDYSCDNPSFVDGTSSSSQQALSAVHVRSTSCPSEALGSQSSNHKKTGSLDGSNSEVPVKPSSSRPKQPAPLVRERFRCIVPYPPNSEYELELKVGDIVYVHKKRDDGWFKGTLQRTGKTGLFPSSFVECF